MSVWFTRRFTIMLVFTGLLSACRSAPGEASPTPLPGVVLTAAAQTAEVRMTELARPTDTPTASPFPTLAETPLPATPTSVITTTFELLVSATPTTGGAASGSDKAEYVADITVEDGADFSPGDSFTKVWRLRNAGTTIWTTAYSLVFIGGAKLGGPDAVPLSQEVAPGDSVDVSVNLVAPQETGTYRGFWEMRNSAGELFTNAVYVEIDVVGGTPGTAATSPPTGGARVTDASISVDNSAPEECPYNFLFTAIFSLSGATTVTYQLEAGSDTPGFEFTLPGQVTADFSAGNHTLTYNLNVSSSVNGWAQFHVLAPNEVRSNQASFTLDCSP